MLELIVGTLVTLVVGRAIFKGYSATGVLLSGGLLLLVITAMMGKPVLPSKVVSTGYIATDIFEYVRFLLNDRGGGLGMLIMVLCGFAGYMSHIGANTILVKLASKPLGIIKSPYILLVAAYLVACAMSLAVSSATGLGVLLMATLFPLMVNMGISRGAAAAVCASPAAIILAPTSGDVVMAAQAANMPLLDFAFKLTLPISLVAIACMAVTHFFWQRYLDQKSGEHNEPVAPGDLVTTAPAFYAILPFTPSSGCWCLTANGARSWISSPSSSCAWYWPACWSWCVSAMARSCWTVSRFAGATWLTPLPVWSCCWSVPVSSPRV